MSARGDARKRLVEELAASIEPAYDERADILAELAETQAALHAATNDVVRLAAELHTAHGQIDRARWLAHGFAASPYDVKSGRAISRQILAALDGGAS